MRLVGNATVIRLEPVGYQFPGAVENRWDGNWLIIAGEVETADGSWTFREPSLTTWEARVITAWLRAVAAGTVPQVQPGERGSPDLIFTEPNLGFSLASRSGDTAQIRVHFSLESAPPWLSTGERSDVWKFFVPVDVALSELARIADSWEQEIAKFPER